MPDDIGATLRKNKGLPFVDRIIHPGKYPFLDLDDKKSYRGDFTTHRSVASHMMSHAPKDNKNPDGSWIVYPEVIYNPRTDTLRQLGKQEAEEYAKMTGQFIEFDTKKEAGYFSRNYKKYWNQTILGEEDR